MIVEEANEFRLIHQYFQSKQTLPDAVIQGIGDDCAVVKSAGNQDVAISVDTAIAGLHFPADADPYDIASRALNTALSDLAAMGATPQYFTLAMAIPVLPDPWLSRFSSGLFDAAQQSRIILIGGDTTRVNDKQSMVFTVTVQGLLAENTGLYRTGAQVGDYIYVSGSLGDAAFGLECYFSDRGINPDDKMHFLDAYLRPRPELGLGCTLSPLASSCIDISDGLLQDLGHILKASSVGADIDVGSIPLSPALTRNCPLEKALSLALSGGDDYKLCFTAPLQPDAIAIDNLSCIGRIKQAQGVRLLNSPVNLDTIIQSTGFDHFHDK